jgi:arginine/serine-rich splicing factor 14
VLESPDLVPEEDEEEDEEDEGAEEAPAHGACRPEAGASKSEGTEGLPGEGAEAGPAGALGPPQATTGTCPPRKRTSSKSLKVGVIPAPKRACLVPEPEGEPRPQVGPSWGLGRVCHHSCHS